MLKYFLLVTMFVGSSASAMAANYRVVTTDQHYSRGAQSTATASCPGGFSPVGGGWNIISGNGWMRVNGLGWDIPTYIVTHSDPTSSGWEVGGISEVDLTLRVYAVCATP